MSREIRHGSVFINMGLGTLVSEPTVEPSQLLPDHMGGTSFIGALSTFWTHLVGLALWEVQRQVNEVAGPAAARASYPLHKEPRRRVFSNNAFVKQKVVLNSCLPAWQFLQI